MSTMTKAAPQTLTITAPNFGTMILGIKGTAPYVQHKFSEKARKEILAKQLAGSTSKKNTKREARDIDAEFIAAQHVSREGWNGIPAPAFRAAMISACRVAGFQMTKAKLSVFVKANGFDRDDGTPLVRIFGDIIRHETVGRLETGVAMPILRPMWPDWSAEVTVRWDADQFTAEDVVNLMARAGEQVGIGEGRPDSKNSAGMGWGTFEIEKNLPFDD